MVTIWSPEPRASVAAMRRALPMLALVEILVACSSGSPSGGPYTGGDDTPPASEMPLGSDNPCWGGVYPDDLKGIGIPKRDILVDARTNDMYDRVCIEARISQYNEEWPAGMDARLVSATDL